VLVDPEQTAVPVTHAKYGKTYHMYLENFPASTTLQLDLYRFKVCIQEKIGREGRRGRAGGDGETEYGAVSVAGVTYLTKTRLPLLRPLSFLSHFG